MAVLFKPRSAGQELSTKDVAEVCESVMKILTSPCFITYVKYLDRRNNKGPWFQKPLVYCSNNNYSLMIYLGTIISVTDHSNHM